jgi:hypothetical protein
MGLFDSLKKGAYDRVELKEGGETKHLNPEEFRALPLDKRVKAILEKRLTFFSGDTVVPSGEALRNR